MVPGEENGPKSGRGKLFLQVLVITNCILVMVTIWALFYPKDICCRSLVLKDQSGNIYASIKNDEKGPSIEIYDDNNKPRIGMGISIGIPKIYLFDENGGTALGAFVSSSDVAIGMKDKYERIRIAIGLFEGEPRVLINDKKEHVIWRAPQ